MNRNILPGFHEIGLCPCHHASPMTWRCALFSEQSSCSPSKGSHCHRPSRRCHHRRPFTRSHRRRPSRCPHLRHPFTRSHCRRPSQRPHRHRPSQIYRAGAAALENRYKDIHPRWSHHPRPSRPSHHPHPFRPSHPHRPSQNYRAGATALGNLCNDMHPWSRDPIWARGPAGAGCQALRGTPKREEMGEGDGVLQRGRGDPLPVDHTRSLPIFSVRRAITGRKSKQEEEKTDELYSSNIIVGNSSESTGSTHHSNNPIKCLPLESHSHKTSQAVYDLHEEHLAVSRSPSKAPGMHNIISRKCKGNKRSFRIACGFLGRLTLHPEYSARWDEKENTLFQNHQAGPGKNESSEQGQPWERVDNVPTTPRTSTPQTGAWPGRKRQPPPNTLDPSVASISSTVLPATRIFPAPSKQRYRIPEVIHGLGDTPRIPCHRILHEFHVENAPPLFLYGIMEFHTAQSLEGIGLNSFQAPVGVVIVLALSPCIFTVVMAEMINAGMSTVERVIFAVPWFVHLHNGDSHPGNFWSTLRIGKLREVVECRPQQRKLGKEEPPDIRIEQVTHEGYGRSVIAISFGGKLLEVPCRVSRVPQLIDTCRTQRDKAGQLSISMSWRIFEAVLVVGDEKNAERLHRLVE
ncbi:hypothetical protein JB92DRAFT_3097674 [Gautieria morchelliformis]|nr:hypothetical protein JB92DRAFT_3097674 [Gautieria morchelliformis]